MWYWLWGLIIFYVLPFAAVSPNRTSDTRKIIEILEFSKALSFSTDAKTEILFNQNQITLKSKGMTKTLDLKSAVTAKPKNRVLVYGTRYCSPASIYSKGCLLTLSIKCRVKKWC